jgi:hypothetical protein
MHTQSVVSRRGALRLCGVAAIGGLQHAPAHGDQHAVVARRMLATDGEHQVDRMPPCR